MTEPQTPQAQLPPPPVIPVPAAPPVAYAVAPEPVKPRKSPGLAGFLSALPGVGHIYLGLYQRAVVFFGVWVLTLAIANHGSGPIGVLIPFWWFFVLIDAVRQANAINETGAAESNLVATEPKLKLQGNLAFGVFLILFGIFFLVDRFVRIDLSFLFEWWMVPVIVFGAWQVFVYYRNKKGEEKKATEVHHPELA
ncbi:MAG: hypothetical protein IT186_25555 [Acidobacteria bacterium]|nr:hypothetical protein [Acidobacteriota bacterium]MCG3191586.1 hypothetical protein [Thermoanaerobaculia bacterium]MCK6684081.1 hypothetical protein [Thermoanaerobaculia bacterium]